MALEREWPHLTADLCLLEGEPKAGLSYLSLMSHAISAKIFGVYITVSYNLTTDSSSLRPKAIT